MHSAYLFALQSQRRESKSVAEWHFKGGELGLRASAVLALKWHVCAQTALAGWLGYGGDAARRTEGGAPFHLVPAALRG
jgi:hypothetical protein